MSDEAHEPDRDDEEVFDVAQAGSELAGALVGGAVGLVAGPPGAIVGGAVGVFVTHGARHVVGRLRARERVRAGAALDLIAADSRERQERGEDPRDDGFFDARGDLRPEGEELLEAVLVQAANSWEERKVALLARLYSLVVHDRTVPAATANLVVRIAGDLTYRQFVALAVLVHHDEHLRGRMRAFMLREEGRAQQDPALLAELDDLGDRRLIVVEGAQGAVGSPSGLFGGGVPPVSALSYGTLRLTDAGEQLVRLTDAGRLIAAEERAAWVEALAVATDE